MSPEVSELGNTNSRFRGLSSKVAMRPPPPKKNIVIFFSRSKNCQLLARMRCRPKHARLLDSRHPGSCCVPPLPAHAFAGHGPKLTLLSCYFGHQSDVPDLFAFTHRDTHPSSWFVLAVCSRWTAHHHANERAWPVKHAVRAKSDASPMDRPVRDACASASCVQSTQPTNVPLAEATSNGWKLRSISCSVWSRTVPVRSTTRRRALLPRRPAQCLLFHVMSPRLQDSVSLSTPLTTGSLIEFLM